jgi:hypothetical protein
VMGKVHGIAFVGNKQGPYVIVTSAINELLIESVPRILSLRSRNMDIIQYCCLCRRGAPREKLYSRLFDPRLLQSQSLIPAQPCITIISSANDL